MKLPWKMSEHWLVVSLLIGFALGMAFGQWYGRESFHARCKNGGMKGMMMERFNKELHLSAEQKREVDAIFDAKHGQMAALQAEMQPKFEALRTSTQTEIRKILNPDQQQKFDAMNAKMEEHWKERQKFWNS